MEDERIEAMEAVEGMIDPETGDARFPDDAADSPGHKSPPPADAEDEESGDEQLRTPVTILFSDIKGSTSYFERKGDVEGLAMLERHNKLLLPCVENNAGRLIKTIGDALMTLFSDPVDAVRAAVGMQNALVEDGRSRPASERIHIRIGIHTGLGLIRDNDVFGDVVNAAARVQSKSLPDQILITDSLVTAARTAGYQVGRLGRTKLEGKEEPIDVFTIGWSPDSTQRLIDDLQSRFEDQMRDMRQARMTAEEDFESGRAEWRRERRELHAGIERLEDELREATTSAREQVTEEFRQELRFELESSEKARDRAEKDLESVHERFETERVGYRAQIESLEKRLVEALERLNNPALVAAEVQKQVEERLDRVRRQWESQWENEREQYKSDIARLKQGPSGDPVAEARRLVQERLKARQSQPAAGSGPNPEQIASLESEKEALQKRVRALEESAADLEESARREISREIRRRYEERSEQAARIQSQLEGEIETLRQDKAAQKESLSARVRELEEAIPQAQDAARLQAVAEVEAEFQLRLDEAERARSALERRRRDETEEWDVERSKLIERLESLETRLEETRDLAFRHTGEPAIEELNRLRHQLEEEYQQRRQDWEEEKQSLVSRIRQLEGEV